MLPPNLGQTDARDKTAERGEGGKVEQGLGRDCPGMRTDLGGHFAGIEQKIGDGILFSEVRGSGPR